MTGIGSARISPHLSSTPPNRLGDVAMITCERVTYDYPGRRALDDITFALAPQSITALVGPNGAGKTTLLRCLAALDSPLRGRIAIAGADVAEDPRAAHRRLGYLPDTYGLYETLSVQQCLAYFAAAHGLPRAARRDAVVRAAARLALTDRMEQAAGTLSRGLRQRLGIAQALIHEPDVLLLDEPASGLDPEARIDLGNLLIRLSQGGMTILVSSHILAELEDYSTHMLVLDRGRLIEYASLAGAEATAGRKSTERLVIRVLGTADGLAAALAEHDGISDIAVEGSRVVCRFAAADGNLAHARAHLLKGLVTEGYAVTDFAVETERLQDAYIARLRSARAADRTQADANIPLEGRS